MAQAPATPKSRRALRRLLAALMPALVPLAGPLAPSEAAALALRAAERGHAPAPAQGVTFLIPLVGPHHVGDWQAVQDRLQGTLDSLLAQTDARWRAVICCQDRPALPDDPRITHLPYDDPTPGNDKWRKLAALYDHMATLPAVPGYVMSFDADDLLHRAAVAEMLTGQASGGYLVQAGYALNHANGHVGLADAPSLVSPLRKPFWKLCGSCVALRHDPAIAETLPFLRAMTQHEHRMFPYLAKLAGRRLVPFATPAVLYVLNHGENFGARRGRVSFKTRFVERFRVTDATALGAIETDFPKP
ncbi:hypothetical protein VK792_03360 [Mesobacterium sp. TK19101]|uniref:Glycosyltransferase family 2 protein n=1 Tax=Mesobacterium hydrothermale TaxID=3111907 RepID=A0ABU6HCY0_9RHOB|nr:hypothetical protein [Mesobacterium sp. TK19101]MEC3860310.1 hypothetical protein [Mesobacterium sp. TK19101]